ncbi:PPC domain-containing protein [Candidatus Poriferisocius sp.]|uniref:PPC domain-containing protein n=1 Tax=Candidatus Poriferisocius sp. TaxID=3101276 RepID=UPI003B5251A9
MKRAKRTMRTASTAGVVGALLAGMLAFGGTGAASAQEPVLISEEVTTQEEPSCETVDLGMLDSTPGSSLEASGRWSAEDCDSRFRSNSDAHTYRFEIAETGRIRVDLTSPDADSYVYLLNEEGNRITEDDDGGVGALDARIERELQAGVYLVEATTTAGRVRGAADFEVVVTQVATCDPQVLGALMPGQDIEVTGFWTPESCQSIFLTGHPSNYFVFTLPEGARVRVDLTSEIGDPALIVAPIVALRSVVPGQVAHNDDAGGTRNSRIEQYFPPDVYGIEATTYRARDLQGPLIDFTLTLTIVEEEAYQNSPLLKIEEIDIPTEVVVGDPLPVNFRIGNVGGDGFPDQAGYAISYAIGPRVYDSSEPLLSRLWPAGASYHTNEETASTTSAASSQVAPYSVTFRRPGPTWVFTAVIAFDGNEDELGFHGLWHDLLVLSNPTYDPVLVEVDGVAYSVSAALAEVVQGEEEEEEIEEGTVVTTVTSVDDPEADIDPETQEKAQYAAGVRTQLLDGIFDRPAIARLAESADPVSIAVTGASSSALLKATAPQYEAVVQASGLLETLADGEAISPVAVEDLVLAMADGASGTYASVAASWRGLLERVDSGGALTFDESSAVQAQLAYAERVIAPTVSAGEIVASARAAELGWNDPEVQAMLSGQPSCDTGDDPLSDPLALAGTEDADTLVALDAEMRAALFAYIVAIDNVLCAIENVDAANSRFLERLGLGQSEQLLALIEPESLPEPEPEEEEDPTHRLRILARLGEDGRIEHGVELFSGFEILPERRYLPSDTTVGTWYSTQDVELDGVSIGQIRARRLADGRVELSFRDFDGDIVAPDIAYLPADLDEGVWYRSSLVEVPVPPEPEEDEEEAEADEAAEG